MHFITTSHFIAGLKLLVLTGAEIQESVIFDLVVIQFGLEKLRRYETWMVNRNLQADEQCNTGVEIFSSVLHYAVCNSYRIMQIKVQHFCFQLELYILELGT